LVRFQLKMEDFSMRGSNPLIISNIWGHMYQG